MNFVKFFTIAWSLWYIRNLAIFKSKHIAPNVVVQNAFNLLRSYRQIHSQQKLATKKHCLLWQKPYFASIKLNVDMALFSYLNKFGMSAILRGDCQSFEYRTGSHTGQSNETKYFGTSTVSCTVLE